MASVAVLFVHGIGKTKRGYSGALREGLRRALGEQAFGQIAFEEVYYQGFIQPQQEQLSERLKPGLQYFFIRDFLLFYLGDATAILYGSSDPESVYTQTQREVYRAAKKVYSEVSSPTRPVVVIAQSLGAQVVSSYIWDAQAGEGLWAALPEAVAQGPEPEALEFTKLGTTAYLLTTGCNIPLFLSGLPKIVPVDKPNRDFRWLNFYNPYDPLGWPLAPMYEIEEGNEEAVRVEDIVVHVGGPVLSWTPWSHSAYWTSEHFVEPAARLIRGLLART